MADALLAESTAQQSEYEVSPVDNTGPGPRWVARECISIPQIWVGEEQ